MYFDDAVKWAEEADYHARADYKMQLAIATNPHLKSDNQRSLWKALEVRPRSKRTEKPEGLEESRARLEAELKQRRKEKGLDW